MKNCSAEKTIPLGGRRGRRGTFAAAAAAAALTVLMMMVVVTVLMVVWLFVFRKGEKKKMCVLAGWLVPGFCFAIFFFLSLQCACFLKTATASGSEDFFCDHLD